MPGSKKERTTSQTTVSKAEPSSPSMPEQQAFQEQLRALAQSAVRAVIELVMREELDAFRGREDLDVLRVSSGHAPTYSDHQCHRKPLQQRETAHRSD
jgi:hypothetical protein